MITSIVNRFLSSIQSSAKAKKELTSAMSTYLASYPVIGNGRLTRPLCTGKNATGCKKAAGTRPGRSVKSQLAQFKARIPQLVDENASGLLGVQSLSSLSDAMKRINAELAEIK